MKKTKNKSEASLSIKRSETPYKEEIYSPPLDVLFVKVFNLRVPDEECMPYSLKITFFDQILLSNVITSSKYKENGKERIIAKGYMKYDPSDYEKMSLFADSPLTVTIQPFKTPETSPSSQSPMIKSDHVQSDGVQCNENSDMYSCNIDILPIFTEKNKITIKQRMEMAIPPSPLFCKSWDNLPEIKLTIKSITNEENAKHRKKIKHANFVTITLVGCYNIVTPIDDTFVFTAASKLPLQSEMHTGIFTFNQGYKKPKRFNSLCFYPHWERVRTNDDVFPNGNKKLEINAEDLQNKEDIDFKSYLNNKSNYTVIWSSFHRTLMLKDTEQWLCTHLRRYQWPIELNIIGESYGCSLMGFLDLLKLLYPGGVCQTTVQLVAPLQWLDRNSMLSNCGCETLIANADKASSTTVQKPSKATTDSANATIDTVDIVRPTGGDGKCAFVILEISLAKPLIQAVIPPHITESDINKMLREMEEKTIKRKCTGRGQLNYDWEATIHNAAYTLRRVPYYGLPDLCSVSRQLSATRVRVELLNSFWQEAAIYVNNKFVIRDFLQSDNTFEEMIMIAHARLMRITSDTLTGTDIERENATLRAARHARQCQDIPHAVQLYLQLIVEGPREANSWRELSTCLRDVDPQWANACINKSIGINPRHPLSLLSKSCMVLENDPDAAEPFFTALLLIYPFSVTSCVCVSAYYLQMEQFHMAQQIIEQVKKTREEGLSDDWRYPRAWERELGDWWDNTSLLPGTNLYYDAADLLLRLRAVSLAEVCVARALTETGASPVYYHLVALCCRLKGQIDNALCHIQQGVEKFGEISYLRSLEGECYHKQKNLPAATAAFSKIGNCGAYIALLSFPCKEQEQRTQLLISDVARRYPCAYAWMTYADYWLMSNSTEEDGNLEATAEQKTARSNAKSCLFRALRYDRYIGRAWALLATLVKPEERRQYCKNMAAMCDYKTSEDRSRHSFRKQESLYFLGKTIRECYCKMCENLFL